MSEQTLNGTSTKALAAASADSSDIVFATVIASLPANHNGPSA
jgi:hypothetical protein